MLILWTAPGTRWTSVIDKAKQSAYSLIRSFTILVSSGDKSSPMRIAATTASTRSFLNGLDFRVNIEVSASTSISGCAVPGSGSLAWFCTSTFQMSVQGVLGSPTGFRDLSAAEGGVSARRTMLSCKMSGRTVLEGNMISPNTVSCSNTMLLFVVDG